MKILVTSKIPKEIIDRLMENFEVDYHDSNIPLTKEEYIERIQNVIAVVSPLSDQIDKEILDAGDKLRIVANYGAGYDNIDIDYAREKGIIVTNAPAPSSAYSTAEMTFALILGIARNVVLGDRNIRAENFPGWRPTYFLGHQLKGKTLGIIGMGNIGKVVSRIALAFGMKVIYYSRHRKEDIEIEGAIYKKKEDLLSEGDFISIHTAYDPELYHMMGKNEFKRMKKTAFFINAARGPLMNEGDLIEALLSKEIKGAALDVYEFEPKVSKELLKMDNVVLTPHLGNATFEARIEMGEAVLESLIDLKKGNSMRYQVNK